MRTILVVDDDPASREYLVTLLGYRGYQLLEAGDGAEGLELVRSKRPDLVIADILMPTMDGYQLVKLLRSERDIADTPVIFYSASYHKEEAGHLASICGVKHVLTKPCEPETVIESVETVLKETFEPSDIPDREFNREHLRVVTDKLVRMSDDLGQVNERISELIDINLHLASERDPWRLLDGLCRSARKLIGASHALLAVGNNKGSDTLYYTTSGLDADITYSIEKPSLHQGITGAVLAERRSFRGAGGTLPDALGIPRNFPPVKTLLAAPIVSLNHAYGWICLTERIGGDFSAEDERLLTILAAQVGRIYENGSLYKELQEKEERFRQLAENINEVFFLVNPPDTRMLYISPAYEIVWGRSRESLYTNPQSWLDAVHPDDMGSAISNYERSKSSGEFDFTYRILRPDESIRWIRSRGFPIHNESGEIYRIAGLAEDITRQKLADDKIRRLNRVYAVLSGINTAIVHIRDKQELFNEACRIAVEKGGFRLAWLGLLSPDVGNIIPQAHAGHEAGYLQKFAALTEEEVRLTASGQAVYSKRPVVRNNLTSTNEKTRLKKEVMARGYRSVASFPLILTEEIVGVISLYASEPDFFDEDEMKLLMELATDISFALKFIDNERKLQYLAYNEPLTGLANRSSLYKRLGETIAERTGDSGTFSLILTNINHFRDINDTLGHSTGDELIRQVALRLKSAVWESDVVSCLGGDDFAVLLPRLASKEHIDLVIRKILNVFQHDFVISEIPVNVEASLGIAMYPDHGDTPDLIWRHADVALRGAKEMYKTHKFYDAKEDHYDPGQLALISELRRAVDLDELVLHFQPKIDLQGARTAGVEALVRWQHPKRGLLYPDKFIPLVERTGLIDSLTIWVIANALRQVYFWHKNGMILNLSVNLSARNLQNPNLKTEILDLARSSRFPLEYLTLEVTESAIMVDPVHAKEMLSELRDAGIKISVDDFGTGQTSLSYLKDLPVSKMKIDKSFVMDIQNPRNFAIVRSAIELGRNLGLSITAEGVEDEQAYRDLVRLGCHQGQGYYFSKPLPPDQLLIWLRNSSWPL